MTTSCNFGKNYPLRLLVSAVLLFYFSGCASVPADRKPGEGASNAGPANPVSDAGNTESEPERGKDDVSQGPWMESNSRIDKWIRYFTTTDRDRFQRFLGRGQKYRKVIEDFLVENELPPELFFLALIESGYQNHATSRARAAGVWQFIPGTGRRYGLQVDRFVDERRDPIRSTEAAAKYLRDLYNIFGSWPLAMAAYNAGEYRIINAIFKGKTRDFWTLVDAKILPSETSEYVPKVIAASRIGADPKQYGFVVEEGVQYPELEAIEVPSPVRFADLAKLAGVTMTELLELNPHVRNARTPANVRRYEVWFPKDKAKRLRERSREVLALRRKMASSLRGSDSEKRKRNFHRVKAGENLTAIARQHGVSVNYLMRVNRLPSSRILPGATLRVTSTSYQPRAFVRHKVRKGENLGRIARRYGMSVLQLKRDNDLRGSRLYPGQTLVIRRDRS